jgi:phosphoribosylaminoimidazole-succinocarboxamide synthase
MEQTCRHGERCDVSEIIYEGKAKKLFTTDDPEVLLQVFKDSATAFNGKKYAEFGGKGALNNAIACHLLALIERGGVPTHYIERVDAITMRVKRLAIIPLEVVVRNVVAGSLAAKLGREEGAALGRPIVEFYYKRDDLGDPMINEDHIRELGVASEAQIAQIKAYALAVNALLLERFGVAGLRLVDMKLEFGLCEGRVVLGDEISPDTCRLWDAQTGARLDKDVFRRELAGLVETYEEVARRLGVTV